MTLILGATGPDGTFLGSDTRCSTGYRHFDTTEKLVDEIEPAMDVADRIEALALRTGKTSRRGDSGRHAAEQLRKHAHLERRYGRLYDGRPACM